MVQRKVRAPQSDLNADLFYRVGDRRAGFRDGDCHVVHEGEAPKQAHGDRLSQRLESPEFARRGDPYGFIDDGVVSDGGVEIVATVGPDIPKCCRNIKNEFLTERPLFLEQPVITVRLKPGNVDGCTHGQLPKKRLIGVIPNCPGERQVLLALPDGAPSEVASHASDKRLAAFGDADNQEIRLAVQAGHMRLTVFSAMGSRSTQLHPCDMFA